MKKYSKIIILIILSIITISYTYYIRPLVDDELFNFGFAWNIVKGLVPYKDFNMIIPPLFSYITAIPLAIFGKKLIIYHIIITIIIVTITNLSYKKIGWKAIIIYVLLLVYPYTGYNMFCLFLLFLLLELPEHKNTDIITAIIISMMFLTKQTLGILVIPDIIFSKQRKKTLAIYGTSILLFLVYLIINNNLYEFIDYCILGMFDFTNKNSTGIKGFFIVEIIIIIILFIKAIKKKDKYLCYILCFQIITFPIVDYFHFIISFIPVVYILLKKITNNHFFVLYSVTFTITFFLLLNYSIIVGDKNYQFLEHYSVNNFMKERVTYKVTASYVKQIDSFLNEYKEYKPYILGNFSYLIKLNNDLKINKYDIINNGNMGYHGSDKYIKEIEEDCKEKKCVFVISDEEITTKRTIQTNREILKYVNKNYEKKYSSNIFSIYSN